MLYHGGRGGSVAMTLVSCQTPSTQEVHHRNGYYQHMFTLYLSDVLCLNPRTTHGFLRENNIQVRISVNNITLHNINLSVKT